MHGLPSEERFGKASLSQPVAPKHTEESHEQCAYYPATEVEDNRSVNGGFLKGPMICDHKEEAHGAFYSEDYVNQMRRLAQAFLGQVDGLLHGHPNPTILLPDLENFREYFK